MCGIGLKSSTGAEVHHVLRHISSRRNKAAPMHLSCCDTAVAMQAACTANLQVPDLPRALQGEEQGMHVSMHAYGKGNSKTGVQCSNKTWPTQAPLLQVHDALKGPF